MAITKLDAVLEAIQDGKTNDEIRDEIDGRLSDKRLDKLRKHPNIKGGSGVDEERVGDPEREKEEIEREVEKIFAPPYNSEVPDGCIGITVPRTEAERTKIKVSEAGAYPEPATAVEWLTEGDVVSPVIEPPAPEFRAVSIELDGLARYRVEEDYIWIGGNFEGRIPRHKLDQFIREIEALARLSDRMRAGESIF